MPPNVEQATIKPVVQDAVAPGALIAALSRWVEEIVLSIPGPARSTLTELSAGAMLAQGGPVTRAILALTPRLGWQA